VKSINFLLTYVMFLAMGAGSLAQAQDYDLVITNGWMTMRSGHPENRDWTTPALGRC